MLNISFNVSHVKYSMFGLILVKDVEDWFGFDKMFF